MRQRFPTGLCQDSSEILFPIITITSPVLNYLRRPLAVVRVHDECRYITISFTSLVKVIIRVFATFLYHRYFDLYTVIHKGTTRAGRVTGPVIILFKDVIWG